MCDHFTVRDGEIVGTPRPRLGFLAGLSLGLLTVLVGFVIAVQGVGL